MVSVTVFNMQFQNALLMHLKQNQELIVHGVVLARTRHSVKVVIFDLPHNVCQRVCHSVCHPVCHPRAKWPEAV